MIRRFFRYVGIAVLVAVFLYAAVDSHAALYPFSSVAISPTWTTVTNAIMMDRDDDGVIDTVYSASSITSTSITFTKQFGSGLTPIAKTFTATGNVIGARFGVYGNSYIIVAMEGRSTSGVASSATYNLLNVDTGTVTVIHTLSQAAGNGWNRFYQSNILGMQRTDNRIVFMGATSPDSSSWTTTLFANTTSLTSTATLGTGVITPFGADPSWNTNIYLPNTLTMTGTLTSSGYVYNDTSTSARAQINSTSVFNNLDYNATLWTNGLKRIAQTSVLSLNSPLWPSVLGTYIPSTVSSNETALYLNYKILKSDLSSEPQKFLIRNGSTLYIGLLSGTTLYYATIPDLTGYAFQAFLLDNYFPTIGGTAASSGLPGPSVSVVTPTTSFSTVSSGIQGFVSGYELQTIGVDRKFLPSVTNQLEVIPVSIPPVTGLTAVTVHINNAPSDSVVKTENPNFSLFGQQYLWSAKILQADDTFSIDLPTNVCFDTQLSQADTVTRLWTDLGTLCASGTMPKQVTYTTNLAFTFWTLPWGTSSNYDDSTSGLETLVRNSNANYTYNLRVYDRNGTLSLQQQYINVNGLDIRTFNITSIQKPATLQILDENNNTLYHTTMGFGNWLDDFQAFSNQQLTIDGFNLVAMMPIIFAAMWTRNTVSMGTMMTVVMIATLGFFGVLAIPEIVLYLMLFIAAIAMVAYKLLF